MDMTKENIPYNKIIDSRESGSSLSKVMNPNINTEKTECQEKKQNCEIKSEEIKTEEIDIEEMNIEIENGEIEAEEIWIEEIKTEEIEGGEIKTEEIDIDDTNNINF